MSLRKSWSASVEISRTLSVEPHLLRVHLRRLRVDDLDLQLLERPVEVLDLSRLELELVERECDFLCAHPPGGLCRLQQVPCFLRLEDLDRGSYLRSCCGHLSPSPSLAMPQCAMRVHAGAIGRSAHIFFTWT